MSARLVAEIAALSRLADFLGKQLLKEAGDAGELRAEVEALKKSAEPAPDFSFDGATLIGGTSQALSLNPFNNNLDLLNQGSDWNKDS